MKIERVIQLEHNYFEIHFDTHQPLTVHEESLIKYELLTSKELSLQELEAVKSHMEYDRAYIGAIQYISYKIRSKQEMVDYLSNVFADEIVFSTVNRLEKEGYIDDKHYAEALRNTIFNTTDKGPKHLEKKLKDQNISPDIIEYHVNLFSDNVDEARILKIYNKELKRHKGSQRQFDMKIKEKLMRRGYLKIHEELLPTENNFDDTKFFEKDFEKYYNKYRKKHNGFTLKQKLIQALMRRGYQYDRISDKLGGMEHEFVDNDES